MTRKQTSRVRVVGARVVLHLMALCYRMDDIVLRFKHLASENHSIVTYYAERFNSPSVGTIRSNGVENFVFKSSVYGLEQNVWHRAVIDFFNNRSTT